LILPTKKDLRSARFTLSQSTKQLLQSIKEPVKIDVFLQGNYQSGFTKLAATTQETLQEFKEISGNNLQYNFISPNDSFEGTETTWGDTLKQYGFCAH